MRGDEVRDIKGMLNEIIELIEGISDEGLQTWKSNHLVEKTVQELKSFEPSEGDVYQCSF